jgi:hypothetical protein
MLIVIYACLENMKKNKEMTLDMPKDKVAWLITMELTDELRVLFGRVLDGFLRFVKANPGLFKESEDTGM